MPLNNYYILVLRFRIVLFMIETNHVLKSWTTISYIS